MTAPLLSVHDLAKSFGGTRAVDKVSFDLAAGETLALAGLSGSGKSTVARMVMRLIEPDAGRIDFMGEDLTRHSGSALRARRRHIQMVFQDTNSSFNPRATVASALLDPLNTFDILPKPQRAHEVRHLLERVGLSPGLFDRSIHELSGGQRQRVAIARALASRPALIVLDEALSAVDASIRIDLLELLLDLQREQGISYLFIAHDLGMIRAIAHRTAILDAGRIAEIGPTQSIIAAPQTQIGQQLVAAAPRLFHVADQP
ncbi:MULTISPECIES: ABC transporter ATP-binding protein [Mesorhizobium]|uniref:ABC transporter ATP-binding protein n=1 Tax=Mesorhizobium denitrificans TaxID=2294114 RepID=A0A371XGX4_9HYPH|nr:MULTISPECIES: ATP-binding cassette domain-containing protein [Mesorhizobium]RFC68471.1 ABC transporter ATP-binding protein [Mesorhizobium denitrificans]